jgi:Zn-dependent protease
MRLSWKMGRVAGIDVYIHATFLLVLFFVPQVFDGGAAAVQALLLIASVFGCVLLHEYGHALTARRFGIETADITLYPIGGVARLRRLPRAPGAELLITLAGPAVNFAIAAALGAALWLGLIEFSLASLVGAFFSQLLVINLMLGLFNLIPAFPMDGGRILRATLSGFIGRAPATKIAAGVGRVLAIVFGLVGLFVTQQPLHVALAASIYFAGRMEEAQVLYEERRREYARFGGGGGVWTAPPGYRWVDRGDGTWQLAPVGIHFPAEPQPTRSPWL